MIPEVITGLIPGGMTDKFVYNQLVNPAVFNKGYLGYFWSNHWVIPREITDRFLKDLLYLSRGISIKEGIMEQISESMTGSWENL